VLTHEFVHLCVPTLDRRHAWFTEGLATYLEPLARARRGLVTHEACWAAFVKHLPEGLPKAGDLGLDRTPTWGRTYWGGALFCLVADLEIRKATENRQSLEDAVKALVAAGATKAVAMDLEQALRLADAGLERPLLLDLYRRWATAPVAVDLDALWQRLGVVREGGSVRFDASAPDAARRP
jgi:predicted metalloprotease with PDZ domain